MELLPNYKTSCLRSLCLIKILLIMKLTTCLMLFACIKVSAEVVAKKLRLMKIKRDLRKYLRKSNIKRATHFFMKRTY